MTDVAIVSMIVRFFQKMAVQLAKNNAVTYVCVCLAKYILEMTILLQKKHSKIHGWAAMYEVDDCAIFQQEYILAILV